MQKIKIPPVRTGFRVGKLTVAEATRERKGGYTVWLCACDCGGSIRLDTRTLQRGTVCDCGCTTKTKPGQKDLTGQRFGRLVALEPTDARSYGGSTVWRCQCDCGEETLAAARQLVTGMKKSCGCLGHPPRKDYVGRRFGMLTVLAYAGKWDGMHHWRCVCDCGKETVVGQTPLQSGKTKSCGCLQKTAYIENLQLIDGTSVTRLEASRSRRLISTNSSGHTGVYLNRKSGKWQAQIGFKGKTYYLGSYASAEEAAEARRKAEERVYGEFLEWYYGVYPERRRKAEPDQNKQRE